MRVELDPFLLFCAYHLGLMPSGQRRSVNAHECARVFGVDKDTLDAALVAHRLDAGSLVHITFDVAAARFDIEASPPGVDLFGLAHMHHELLERARDTPRDWSDDDDASPRG
jgi:hypothetical protein